MAFCSQAQVDGVQDRVQETEEMSISAFIKCSLGSLNCAQ